MLKKENQKGFTIIEVLIVLAIAGLILLIVFLAVPALQRNSRNNGRTNDTARVGASVNEWVSNNNGATFTAGTGNANLTSVLNQAGTMSQYTLTVAGTCAATGNFCVATGAQGALTVDAVRVVTGAQCGTSGATTAATGTRKMALQYVKESSSATPTPVCVNI